MDGLSIFYRYKQPAIKTQNVLLFLHRGHEHSARIMPFANNLSQDEYWCFAFDLRGHGRSDGPRAWAENFDVWVQDLNSFTGHIQQQFGLSPKDTVLIANSVGSVMALSWILNYAPNLKGCILGAPAFSIKLYIPLALPVLKLVSRFSNKRFVTSYVRSSLLTRDKNEAKAYDNDKLITKQIGVNILTSLFATVKNIFNRLKDFETPVLVFTAGKDYIVDNKYHNTFVNGISSAIKEHIFLPEFRHALFHEKDQQRILIPCQQFIKQLFLTEVPKQLPSIIPHAREHTLIEYAQLSKKASPTKQFYYTTYRYLLEKIGRYSDGVSTGLNYGFDSGISLDYVYRNQSSGSHWAGKLIDRVYLNSIGWQGIRTRKANIKNTLTGVIKLLEEQGVQPVILDIASGPARYLFEIQQESKFPVKLLLNDNDQNSLNHAKTLANEFNASDVSFTSQNAFEISAESIVDDLQPNIIIVSGLFELYDNNPRVHQVIKQLFNIISNGGYLIYTGQPWHPQIEMIGRVLNNRNGKKWLMRRRVQQEMDLLVESTGFSKLNTAADSSGIFTVSCAQKP
jgi:alpha-beta hydrolase superfamily lysophospholipase